MSLGKTIAEIYCAEMRRIWTKYYPAWPPQDALSIGDLGMIEGGMFEKKGSLGELGVPFDVSISQNSYSLSLQSSVEAGLGSGAGGELSQGPVGPQVGIGIDMRANKDGWVSLVADDCHNESLVWPELLKDCVYNRFKDGRWQLDWHVVTGLIRSASCSIKIFRTGAIGASVGATGAESSLDLVKGRFDLKGVRQASAALEVNASGQLTPLVSCHRLTSKWFTGIEFEQRRGALNDAQRVGQYERDRAIEYARLSRPEADFIWSEVP